jgi:hypothetical protein
VVFPRRFKWHDQKEKMWDLLLDDDSMSNMNRYHLLRTHFNQVAIACNCNPVYGEICVVELGQNVEPIMPVEYNHFYLRSYDEFFRNISDPTETDYSSCFPDMPDYYMCVWSTIDFTREPGFERRRLDQNGFPDFKLAFDPTCSIGSREGYCSEIDYEASLDSPPELFGNYLIDSQYTAD